MNKQRKVLITITYNEMGVIIDTKTEELGSSAQLGTDLISRQAAIEAICAICGNDCDKSEFIYNAPQTEQVILCPEHYGLSTLPSAQPEVIRCGQCKYAKVADPEDSQDGYTCQFHRGSIWFSGSYCSWAERREENE